MCLLSCLTNDYLRGAVYCTAIHSLHFYVQAWLHFDSQVFCVGVESIIVLFFSYRINIWFSKIYFSTLLRIIFLRNCSRCLSQWLSLVLRHFLCCTVWGQRNLKLCLPRWSQVVLSITGTAGLALKDRFCVKCEVLFSS